MNALPSTDEAAALLADRFEDAEPLDLVALACSSPALVVAPHPDDESLGCGGLLALLGDAGVDVRAILVTDGAASHPRSTRYDAAARRALRDREWLRALACLGLRDGAANRLGCPDGAVPVAGDPRFAPLRADLQVVLEAIAPQLVLLPWRRDPHPDHRASHALVRAALAEGALRPRCLEYIVWTGERATADEWPRPGEACTWRLDIAAARARKRLAIAAHRSQHGEVIDDDPTGFVVAPAMRRRAEESCEHFFEVDDWP